MKLVKLMVLCIVCLLVGSAAVSSLASDSTNLMREIMFERDAESMESSETAILDGILAFSIPSDWEKMTEEEMGGIQGFRYYCTDEDGLTVFFEGFVDDITIHIDREMISYNYYKEQLEKEKIDHIVASFKGIDMILTGDDIYAVCMCLTQDAKLLGFGFESGTGKIADAAQSEKLIKDITAIIQSVQCLSDNDLASFDDSFWNEDDSEDTLDAEDTAISEDAEVSFFEAVTSHYMPAAALVHLVSRAAFGDHGEGSGLYAVAEDCRETMKRLFAENGFLDDLLRVMDQAEERSRNDKTDVENIHLIGEGWTGEEALGIALYCSLKYQNDFSKAVIAAVNHNGDSDSTGAITGNIVGAWLGYEAIEEKWLKDLELRRILLEMADDLYIGCPKTADEIRQNEKWNGRYGKYCKS